MIDQRVIHKVINSTQGVDEFVDKFLNLNEIGPVDVSFAQANNPQSPKQIEYNTHLNKYYKKSKLLKLLNAELGKKPYSIETAKEKDSLRIGRKKYFMLNYNFPEKTSRNSKPETVVHLKLYNGNKPAGFFSKFIPPLPFTG